MAHRLTKPSSSPPALSPLEVAASLDQQKDFWSNLWRRDQAELVSTRARLNEIRKHMLIANDTQMILTKKRLHKVVRSARRFAGKGPDTIDKTMAMRLPESGWDDLTQVLQATVSLGIVPLQFLQSWIALIPKAVGE